MVGRITALPQDLPMLNRELAAIDNAVYTLRKLNAISLRRVQQLELNVLSSMPAGAVLFVGPGGVLAQDASSLLWDNANKRLGIGVTLPAGLTLTSSLNVGGTAGNLQISSAGIVAAYNGLNTAGNGASILRGSYDAINVAAVASNLIVYAVPSTGAGVYRVSFVAKVTQAATTSSTLGGVNGFQVTYADQNDSVVVTTPAGHLYNSTAINLALNTTQAVYSGCIVINAKASTNIRVDMDYSTSGATAMQYNLHIRTEAL